MRNWAKAMMLTASAATGLVAGLLGAARAEVTLPPAVIEGLAGAEVAFLGEVHDNAQAHLAQAAALRAAAPKAVVFEMLSPEQAARLTPEARGDVAALGDVLGWEEAGWPDFTIYAPIFAALGEARAYGAAVPREAARGVMQTGIAAAFGTEAVRYGLDQPLGAQEQAARETFQMEAHCNALPEEMLPVMVDIQRYRDAALARAVAQALQDTGGPVAVITGNGHARRDWGAPVYVARALPEAVIFTLGVGEPGGPEGRFDAVIEVPAAEREDPCAAFDKG
ncbi:ChaN family lipoprotein [Rhodalgimonas zhirmunskyi]|uniref:ChaN family lipoprotein n=1 Tax=Rhodalgimonas zhirmunskyi TaxID=2964767 RepID=A0AAJ1X4V8_9RHOB|nr:ChaN family lipoprotein [Rhodoalgimonas zhirmunskyi]MDQ2094658.1 ChaN family lipoprotein [Rhodoalgimonas zhirmunskyi]